MRDVGARFSIAGGCARTLLMEGTTTFLKTNGGLRRLHEIFIENKLPCRFSLNADNANADLNALQRVCNVTLW